MSWDCRDSNRECSYRGEGIAATTGFAPPNPFDTKAAEPYQLGRRVEIHRKGRVNMRCVQGGYTFRKPGVNILPPWPRTAILWTESPSKSWKSNWSPHSWFLTCSPAPPSHDSALTQPPPQLPFLASQEPRTLACLPDFTLLQLVAYVFSFRNVGSSCELVAATRLPYLPTVYQNVIQANFHRPARLYLSFSCDIHLRLCIVRRFRQLSLSLVKATRASAKAAFLTCTIDESIIVAPTRFGNLTALSVTPSRTPRFIQPNQPITLPFSTISSAPIDVLHNLPSPVYTIRHPELCSE